MTDEQIQSILDYNDEYDKLFFLFQATDPDDKLQEFYEEAILPYEDEYTLALMENLGETFDLCSTWVHDKYLVFSEESVRAACEESLDYMVRERTEEIPQDLRYYFDSDAYLEDLIDSMSAGEILSRYDGNEEYEIINGTTYYIYRQY